MTYSTPLLTPVYREGVSVSFFIPTPAHLIDQLSTFFRVYTLLKILKSFKEIIYFLTGIVYR